MYFLEQTESEGSPRIRGSTSSAYYVLHLGISRSHVPATSDAHRSWEKWLHRGPPRDSNLGVASTNKIVCRLPWLAGCAHVRRECDAQSYQAHLLHDEPVGLTCAAAPPGKRAATRSTGPAPSVVQRTRTTLRRVTGTSSGAVRGSSP